jgi:hypothetical protein
MGDGNMADDSTPQKVLTLVRMADGRLVPHVDGVQLAGWVDTTTNSNGSQQLTQMVFHSSMILFETARNPLADKMH